MLRLIRLIHGDVNPIGPGFKSESVNSAFTGPFPGKYQKLRVGSYVRIPQHDLLDLEGSFSIHMWIRPTIPDKERQTLISRVSADGVGYALRLERGRLSLQVGTDPGAVVSLVRAVEPHTWYSVTAVFDAESREARLWLSPLAPTAGELADAATQPLQAGDVIGSGDVLIAAEFDRGRRRPRRRELLQRQDRCAAWSVRPCAQRC